MALSMEKKTRTVWTLYEKWSVVEALLGSGMTVTEYCRDRSRVGQSLDWQRVAEWKQTYEKQTYEKLPSVAGASAHCTPLSHGPL